ncbi:MAG: PadR family transcriptional regulator [Actinomycetota bacterium]|nr:helix-turn-helix transcriptional regulator [Rubrobacter sp.]MDQ3568722.1 PadR family transcriptional regulator [Actinomycetota bacterium]
MTDKHLAPPLASPSDQRYANIRRHRGAGDPGLLTDSEGWLVPLLLVSMLEGNVYGGQFESRVEALGFSLPRPGMMYQTLRTMEQEGLIVSDRAEDEVLLSRWRFEPTEAGEAYLEFWVQSLSQYQRDTEQFLRAYESMSDRTPEVVVNER